MHNRPHPAARWTVTTAGKKLRISRTTLSRILNGKGISADMSLRISALFVGRNGNMCYARLSSFDYVVPGFLVADPNVESTFVGADAQMSTRK